MKNNILEILNKELLHMQGQERENKCFDSFLTGRIDAYEEIIYMIEKWLYN